VVDREAAREALVRMLEEHDQSIAQLGGEGRGDDSQRSADGGEALTSAERNQALLDSLAGQRAQVVAALGRLDDGSYGRCTSCGVELPDERLEARPEAALCVRCQAAAESR